MIHAGRLKPKKIILEVISLVIIATIAALLSQLEPTAAEADITQPMFSHGKREKLFPRYIQVTVFVFVVPSILIAISFLANIPPILNLLVSYFAAICLSFCCFYAMKAYVGWPRPDTHAACKGELTKVCQKLASSPSKKTQFKSFPSGDAALAMCGASFLSFVIAGISGSNHGYWATISLLPVFCGLLITVSRVADRAHFVSDVTAGSFIGFLLSAFTYKLMGNKISDEEYY
jgi:membrane-associated phospholipid phosphatase